MRSIRPHNLTCDIPTLACRSIRINNTHSVPGRAVCSAGWNRTGSGGTIRRRDVVSSSLCFLIAGQGAFAAGIEGIPRAEKTEGGFKERRRKNQELIDKNSEAFENSDVLRVLRERSDANREKNRKALQERYCYRQAELGVGDCAGLRLIPGATKSGKQKTPEWLKTVLQKIGQLPPDEATPIAAPEAAAGTE